MGPGYNCRRDLDRPATAATTAATMPPATATLVTGDFTRTALTRDAVGAYIGELCAIPPRLTAVDMDSIVNGVYEQLPDGDVEPETLVEIVAGVAGYMYWRSEHDAVAARAYMHLLHQTTSTSVVDTLRALEGYVNPETKRPAPLVAANVLSFAERHADAIEAAVQHERDFTYSFFSLRTLWDRYLLKCHGHPAERPQYMLMRVALGLHAPLAYETVGVSNTREGTIHGLTEREVFEQAALARVLETYDALSRGQFTHATPTLCQAGTTHPQLASCFLVHMSSDSIPGIFDTLKRCAEIGRRGGGIATSMHPIRASGSYIAGTNGTSNGLVPMVRIYDKTTTYVDQGGNKRPGTNAPYLPLWHADALDVFGLSHPRTPADLATKKLNYGAWVSNEFMQRVADDGEWSFFCPNECPGLADVWGQKFTELYRRYETEGKARATMKARDVFHTICSLEAATGRPYVCHKDFVCRRGPQKHLGAYVMSNLCTYVFTFLTTQAHPALSC
jgi:ribonucleotide reductase alpha subunit